MEESSRKGGPGPTGQAGCGKDRAHGATLSKVTPAAFPARLPFPCHSRQPKPAVATRLKGRFLQEAVPDLWVQSPEDPTPRHLHISYPPTRTVELPTSTSCVTC